jgi:hypothetical protein
MEATLQKLRIPQSYLFGVAVEASLPLLAILSHDTQFVQFFHFALSLLGCFDTIFACKCMKINILLQVGTFGLLLLSQPLLTKLVIGSYGFKV